MSLTTNTDWKARVLAFLEGGGRACLVTAAEVIPFDFEEFQTDVGSAVEAVRGLQQKFGPGIEAIGLAQDRMSLDMAVVALRRLGVPVMVYASVGKRSRVYSTAEIERYAAALHVRGL